MSDTLRAHLIDQLTATAARQPHDDILRDVPPEVRGVVPEGLPDGYSLWQLLEHTRISQADYLSYCVDPDDYTFPTWPDDYWPASEEPPSDVAWTESIGQFEADLQTALDLVQNPDIDIAGDIPHAEGDRYHGTTYAQELGAIADHNAYHLGQIVTVRRLLGAWPPPDPDA